MSLIAAWEASAAAWGSSQQRMLTATQRAAQLAAFIALQAATVAAAELAAEAARVAADLEVLQRQLA